MGLYTNIYWQMIISHFRVAILDLPHFQAHPFRRENRPCPAKPSSFSGLGRKFPCIEPGTSMMTLNKSSVLSGWTSMNPKSPSPLTSSMPLHFPFNSPFLQHTKKKTSKKKYLHHQLFHNHPIIFPAPGALGAGSPTWALGAASCARLSSAEPLDSSLPAVLGRYH